jgi:ABC-type nitrate/sulfonate/bicarbonate transport system substrate-binding protein
MPSQFRVPLGSRLRASLACISGAIALFAATRQSFLKSQTDLVKRFMKAYVEGIHRFKTDKTAALATLEKYTKQKTTPATEKIYDVYASRYFKRAPEATAAGIQTILEEISASRPLPQGTAPVAIPRVALYSELVASGFIDALYQSR